jgi:hypothetical protein
MRQPKAGVQALLAYSVRAVCGALTTRRCQRCSGSYSGQRRGSGRLETYCLLGLERDTGLVVLPVNQFAERFMATAAALPPRPRLRRLFASPMYRLLERIRRPVFI